MNRRVLYVQFTSPTGYPPLLHSATILADAGCSVVMLGVRVHGHNLAAPVHPRLRVRCLPAASGIVLKLTYLLFGLWASAWAVLWRPHWIYASESTAAPVARLLKRLRGAGVVFHEHDVPGEVASARVPSAFMRLVLNARERLVAEADLCVVPSEGRIAALDPQHTAQRVAVVWNCPRRQEAELARPPRPPHADLRVLFQGSVVPSRLPLSVIDALARVARARLVVIGYETAGHRGYLEAIRDRARAVGIESRVEVLAAVPRHVLLDISASCDVGLALFGLRSTDRNETTMIGASNKPFEYLACGLPLIVAHRPEWKVAFIDSGLARGCDPDDAASVAAAMQWYADHPSERQAMGAAGRQRVLTDWNYEHGFAPVAAMILERSAGPAGADAAGTGQ